MLQFNSLGAKASAMTNDLGRVPSSIRSMGRLLRAEFGSVSAEPRAIHAEEMVRSMHGRGHGPRLSASRASRNDLYRVYPTSTAARSRLLSGHSGLPSAHDIHTTAITGPTLNAMLLAKFAHTISEVVAPASAEWSPIMLGKVLQLTAADMPSPPPRTRPSGPFYFHASSRNLAPMWLLSTVNSVAHL
ncbi:hypothetical protein FRC08_002049 [Ceratobasidium sp. 394]|nr:hypothetical protein FRC08_002049 [Ceratobasidium sp. 394]